MSPGPEGSEDIPDDLQIGAIDGPFGFFGDDEGMLVPASQPDAASTRKN